MDTYQLTYSFKITRRLATDFTPDEFHGHIATVAAHLGEMEFVVGHRVDADLGSASLQMLVAVTAANLSDAKATAGRCLAEAIRSAGAIHQGLLPERHERDFYRVSYSGLKRQTWRQRRVEPACV